MPVAVERLLKGVANESDGLFVVHGRLPMGLSRKGSRSGRFSMLDRPRLAANIKCLIYLR
jgi:hypothetical protein